MFHRSGLVQKTLYAVTFATAVTAVAYAAGGVTVVDTGPIWNNQDANLKCPKVCGARKWNGAWRTTVFQKVSQCDCADAPAAPAPAPAPAAGRDCGTGRDDPGCNTPLKGVLPMLVDRYKPGMAALTSEPNELMRQDMLGSTIGKNTLTARQFKAFLALFENELTRLEVAKKYAPKVVDPDRALDAGATFSNNLVKKEYLALFGGKDADE